MIKALFFDIDGTLVSFNTHEIPSSTLAAIAEAKAKGIKIFIATGHGNNKVRCIFVRYPVSVVSRSSSR